MLQVRTTNAFLKGMLGILAVCTIALGPLAMFNLYFMPYWINVVWLDIVTYLHHHGPEDETEKGPMVPRRGVHASQHRASVRLGWCHQGFELLVLHKL